MLAHTQLELPSDSPQPIGLLAKMFQSQRKRSAHPERDIMRSVATRVLLAVGVRGLYGERLVQQSASSSALASYSPPTPQNASDEASIPAVAEQHAAADPSSSLLNSKPDPDLGPDPVPSVDQDLCPDQPPPHSSSLLPEQLKKENNADKRSRNDKAKSSDPLVFVRVRERCALHQQRQQNGDTLEPSDSCLECLFRNAYISLDEPQPMESDVKRHTRSSNLGDLLSLQAIQRVRSVDLISN